MGRTARRGYGEGSVFYDKARRRWIVLLDLGRDYDGNRRRVARSGRTKIDALALLRDLQSEADRGEDPRGARRTALDVFEDFKVNGIDPKRSSGTRYKNVRYARSFCNAMGNRPLREVGVRQVEHWLRGLAAEDLSHATLVSARACAAQLVDHAIRVGWLSPGRNPVRLARFPETKEADPKVRINDESIMKLLAAAREEWWYPLLAFVASTGVRIGEAAALAWSDVDVEERTVVIRRAVRLESGGKITLTAPKAGSTRKIEITRELVELIKAHRVKVAEAALARGVPAPDIAFPTPSGTLADPNNLRRWLRQVSTKAKVEMPGFHALRHAVASSLADAGEVPIRVAALLGHATPRTTLAVYTHPVMASATAGLSRATRILEKGDDEEQ